MKYSQTKQLSSTKFKRLTGVNRKTYQLMVRIVKGKKAAHKKSGRPPELIVEDQVFWTLDKKKGGNIPLRPRAITWAM